MVLLVSLSMAGTETFMRIHPMTTLAIRFTNIFVTSLVAGAMFGIWLGYNPHTLTASAYIEQQQNAINALNVIMPILGAVCIALTLGQASLVRSTRSSLYLLLIGAGLLITAGLITKFGNQPINARVITWSATAPPATWELARDQWWHWHILRTLAGLAALACVIAASLMPIPPRTAVSGPTAQRQD
jgi:uncharacterized membrane protein